jgi:hypothetical protein
MVSAFNARDWIRRWEDAGGGYGRAGDKFSLMLPERCVDALNPIAGELRDNCDRWLSVKMELAGRP